MCVFGRIARTGNTAAVVQEIHVTPSAISRLIAVAENFPSVDLLRRERPLMLHAVILWRSWNVRIAEMGDGPPGPLSYSPWDRGSVRTDRRGA